MNKIKENTGIAIAHAINDLYPGVEITPQDLASYLEYPPDTSMGNLALPCFRLSRPLRTSPDKIAASLGRYLTADKLPACLSSAKPTGGYLNFRVSDNYLTSTVLPDILVRGELCGATDEGAGKTIVLDYSSPNVAKPFHVGHLGSTVIGHSLRKLFEYRGYKCISINHLGDWGTQFGKMIVAYKRWGDCDVIERGGIDELVELYVKFHAEAEVDKSLEDEARQEFHKLETGDEENLKLWRWFIDVSMKEYDITYKQLGITFDSYAGESFYIDKMDAQIEKLREASLLKLDNGASIVDLSEYDMPPCLILKSDGSTLYTTRDIAAAVYRYDTYHFDRCIYVTSSAQCLHFAQLFRIISLMGYDWADRLVHVPYGTVSINGEKLATRTGNVVLLKDLFRIATEKVYDIISEKNPALEGEEKRATAEAVGVGAIVFYYLTSNRIRDINFNMDDALNFEGNTGPYAMYTYARTCSILRKATADGIEPDTSCGGVTTPEERETLFTLSRFGEAVDFAIRDYEPSVVTRYILDLCAAFNRFYHNCPILTAKDEKTVRFRLALTSAVKNTLGAALDLICLKKTEKI
ncbi:MAG: arginine--tRNA ligase [Eubacteriales bacterium]|jgi:arginyl-tRNA synthetase|nr:arginine--tRNA ligase [Clostridiales bacterium]